MKDHSDLLLILNILFEYRDGNLIRKTTVNYRAKKGDIAGGINGDNYHRTSICGKRYLTHRLIFLMCKGYMPQLIDHKDQDTANNNIENLRDANPSKNGFNSKARNKSGFKGCYFSERSKRWTANIKIFGKTMHLGTFLTGESAYKAYCNASEKAHGEFADHLSGRNI